MSRNMCEKCAKASTRYKHWLEHTSANELADHLAGNGMSKENVSANLEWWRSTRDAWSESVDEQNNRLTPAEAFRQGQEHARAQQYTVADDTAAHDIRYSYWKDHDPFQDDEAIMREALADIRKLIANMGRIPSKLERHTEAEIERYMREKGVE